MAVKGVFLNEGIICGEVSEIESNGLTVYRFHKPVLLQPAQTGISLQNFLGFFKEESVDVRESDIRFGTLFEPVDEIINYYNSQVNPSNIVLPDSKIIV